MPLFARTNYLQLYDVCYQYISLLCNARSASYVFAISKHSTQDHLSCGMNSLSEMNNFEYLQLRVSELNQHQRNTIFMIDDFISQKV